jgi:hypothetical protein
MTTIGLGSIAGRLGLLVSGLATIAAPLAMAQTVVSSADAIQALRTELTLLGNRSGGADPQLIENATDLLASIEGKWLAAGATLPPEYRLSLTANAEALRAVSSTGSPAAAHDVLLEVSRDLELKEGTTTGGLGAGSMFKTAVEVTVRTLRGTAEESGYLVRCNPRLLGVRQPALFVFSSASSPTVRSLPPGNYVLWVERQDGTILTRQDIEVGSSGTAKEIIGVVLP